MNDDFEAPWVECTYGFTSPPEGWVIIQANDDLLAARVLDPATYGDLDAAKAYVTHHGGGKVLCVGDGEEISYLTDVMVTLDRSATVTVEWVELNEALSRGILDVEYLAELPYQDL